MTLLEFLKVNIPLHQDELVVLDNTFKTLWKPKGSILVAAGALSKKLFFMEKGVARVFYHQGDREITQSFFVENTFKLSAPTIRYDQPSPCTITLLEDSNFRSIDYANLELLLERSTSMEKLIRIMLIQTIEAMNERMNSIQFTSAHDRYNYLLKNHPDLILRVPLGYIASYLGITQQTLSVIRGKQ